MLDHSPLKQSDDRPVSVVQRSSRVLRITCLIIITFTLFSWRMIEQIIKSEPPSVTCLYVGQGDATLITNGEGDYALFDAGTERAAASLARRLKRRGVRRLGWVAISHLHPDHYGGLATLVEHFEIGEVRYHGRDTEALDANISASMKGEINSTSSQSIPMTWAALKQRLIDHQIPIKAQARDRSQWGHLTLHWLFSHPAVELSENDASIALLISLTNQPASRALLSGDLESKGEARLRDAWHRQNLGLYDLSLWQINHHGSRTSTQRKTVQTLKPRIGVLSLDGAHKFSFPHPKTIKTLTEHNVSMIRLDLDGDYTFKF